nr:DUF3810 domain-containing protein [Bacteroidaceae bacterium]
MEKESSGTNYSLIYNILNKLSLSYISKAEKWRLAILFLMLTIIIVIRTIPGGGDLYCRHIYPLIITPLSLLSSLLPFSISEVFYTIGISWLIINPIKNILIQKKSRISTLIKETEIIVWLYVWFYAAWGLNYNQSSFYVRTGTPPAPYSIERLRKFADSYVIKLNTSYTTIRMKDEELVRKEILNSYIYLSEHNMGIHSPFTQRPRVKTMLYTFLFSKAGIRGTAGPYFGEYIINGDLLPHEYPFVYAHEYSHHLGITNEGEANFYAYMACIRSSEPSIRMSGYMGIYGYILSALYTVDPSLYLEYYNKIRPEVHRLALSTSNYWENKYSPTLNDIQNAVFNLYLRSNNVADGTKSYS